MCKNSYKSNEITGLSKKFNKCKTIKKTNKEILNLL